MEDSHSSKTHDPLGQRPEWDAGLPLFSNLCPLCGGILKPGRVRCSICRGEEQGTIHTSRPTAPAGWLQFSIETLLLVTTLIAACLGLCVAVPPLGILVTVVALAALIRTAIVGRQYLRAGVPFLATEKVGWFVISLFIIVCAIGLGFLVFAIVVGLTWIVAGILRDYGPPQTPANQIGFLILGDIFWLSVIFGPLAAAIWFLWKTRPRG